MRRGGYYPTGRLSEMARLNGKHLLHVKPNQLNEQVESTARVGSMSWGFHLVVVSG